MREANSDDLNFLADCYVKIACHMKSGEQDFYIARLPEAPDDAVRNHVGRYVGREDALTVLEESGGKPIACLMASVGGASFRHPVSASPAISRSAGSSPNIAAQAWPRNWYRPPRTGFE